jgi:hypothetical protein
MYGFRGNDWVVVNSNFYRIENLDIACLSEYELHAQRMCYEVGQLLREWVPGFSRSYVDQIGTDLGIRTSRAIVGQTALHKESLFDSESAFHAPDVVGVTPVVDTEMRTGEYFRDFTCDVPLGIMVPRGVTGLLVGSAKSVDTQPRGLIRGMTGCMICGQAAGVSCALAAKDGVRPGDLPVLRIQRELLSQDVYLGSPDRLADLKLT